MEIIGIDVGKKGAIALITHAKNVEIFDTPLIDDDYYIPEMADIVSGYDKDHIHVFLEKNNAMPKQGVVSMFTFGKGYGIWLGILGALKIPYTLVTPQAWKKAMMAGMRNKDDSRLRACQLFPLESLQFARKKDVGRADALLIAEFGRRKLLGG